MDGLLALIASFPTAVFAALAVLCLAWWLLVLVGALDLEGAHGVAGAGHAHHALDAAGGAGGGSVVGEALAALGLAKVPLTIPLSTFSLAGFLVSAVTRGSLEGVLPAFASALVATVASVGLAGVAAVAASRLFVRVLGEGPVPEGGLSLVGRTGHVTIAVDGRSGQLRIDESIIVSVRTRGPVLAEGTEVVVLDRDDDGVFVVDALKKHLPDVNDRFAELVTQATAPVSAPRSDEPLAPALPHKDKPG